MIKKRILFFTILMIVSMICCSCFSKEEVNNNNLLYLSAVSVEVSGENQYQQKLDNECYLLYEKLNDTEVAVVGYNNINNSPLPELSIPEYIENEGNQFIVSKITNLKEVNLNDLREDASRKISIPSTVTSIDPDAFAGNTSIQEIVFSNGSNLSYIGANAFKGCTLLKTIKLPNSLVELGDSAFEGCTSLVSLELSNGLKMIAPKTFYGTTVLNNIIIPDSVEVVGESAFENSGLIVANLGTGIQKIHTKAFNASKLSYIYLKGTAPEFSANVFYNHEQKDSRTIIYHETSSSGWEYYYDAISLEGVYTSLSKDGFNEIRESHFNILDFVSSSDVTISTYDYQRIKYNIDKNSGEAKVINFSEVNRSDVTIPDVVIYDRKEYKVESITKEASSNIYNNILTKIVVSEGIKSISDNSFDNLLNLKSLCLMSNETTLGANLFVNNDYEVIVNGDLKYSSVGIDYSSKSYSFKILNKDYLDDAGIFYTIKDNGYAVVGSDYDGDDETSNTSKYYGDGNVVIPDYVNYESGFYKVSSLGRYAFYNNFDLESLTLGSFIGENEDSDLTGDKFSGIWDCSLRNCTNLKEFSVASRNKYICASNLVSGEVVTTGDFLCQLDVNTKLPSKIIKAAVDVTTMFSDPLKKMKTINTIEAYAFANCYSLETIDLVDITIVGDHAFENTSIGINSKNINSAIIDLGNLTYLGDYAFANCYYIKEFNNIPDFSGTDEKFGLYPFKNCYNLEKFTTAIGNTTYIAVDGVLYKNLAGKYMLMQFPAKKNVGDNYLIDRVLINGNSEPIRVIDAYAFAYSQLRTVELSDNVYIVGKEAFANSYKLNKVKMGTNVDYLGLEILPLKKSESNSDVITFDDVLNGFGTSDARLDKVELYEQEVFDNCYALTNFKVSETNKYYHADTNGILFNKDKTTLLIYPQGVSRITYTIPSTVTKIALEAFENNTHLQSLIVPEGVTEVGAKAFNGCVNLSSIYFRSLEAPMIYEQTFNSTGANKGGLNIYCIQMPAAWYSNLESVWSNYKDRVSKYNAIQVVPNDSVVADALYTLFVSDSDGNGLSDKVVTVIVNGKEKEYITDINGYAIFTIPNSDVLDDNATIGLEIVDPNGDYYTHNNEKFKLDLFTAFSEVTLVSKPTLSGDYYYEISNEDGEVTRTSNISNEETFVNKAGLAKIEYGNKIEKDADGNPIYEKTMQISLKLYWDEAALPKTLSILQNISKNGELKSKVFDFANPTSNPDISIEYVGDNDTSIKQAVITFNFDPSWFSDDDADAIIAKFECEDSKYNLKEELKLKVFYYEYSFSHGSMLNLEAPTLSIDDDVPILGGFEFGISLKSFKYLTGYYESDKYVVLLNIGKDFLHDGDIDLGKADLNKFNKIVDLIKKTKLGAVNDEPDKSLVLEVQGAVEFAKSGLSDPNQITRGSIIGTLTYEVERGSTVVFWVVPVRFTLIFSAEIGLEFQIELLEYDEEKYFFENCPLNIDIGVDIEISAGVGCSFASVGVYGSASLDIAFEVASELEYHKVIVDLDFGIYVKAKLGFVKISKKWTIASKEYVIYDSDEEKASDEKNYKIRYVVKRDGLIFDEVDTIAEAFSVVLENSEGIFQPSAGPIEGVQDLSTIEPKIVTYNGETYKFYIDDVYANEYSSLYNEYNYLKLVYQKLNSDGTWSNPQIINNDINNEIEFDVISTANGIHIIYVRATEEISESTAVDFTKKLNLCGVLFDGYNFSNYSILSNTENYVYDVSLNNVNGIVYASWIENTAGEIYGASSYEDTGLVEGEESTTVNNNNIIKVSKLDSTNWQMVQSIDNLGLISSVRIQSINGQANLIYLGDADNKLSTSDDKQLFIGTFDNKTPTLVQINANGSITSTYEMLDVYSINNKIVIYSGNQFISGEYLAGNVNIDITETTFGSSKYVIDSMISGLSGAYELVYLNNKLYGLAHFKSVEVSGVDKVSLYFALYDSTSNKFFNSIKIVDVGDDCFINHVSSYELNGACYVVYNVQFTTSEGEYYNKVIEVKLEKNNDLILEDVYVELGELEVNEKFAIDITITNDSFETLNGFTLNIYDNGNLVATRYVSELLAAGETKVITISDLMFSEFKESYQLEIIANELFIEETAELVNNKLVAVFSAPDLEVTTKLVEMGEIDYLLVIVQNIGNLISNGSTIGVCSGVVDAFSGKVIEPLYSLPIDSLAPGEYKYYTIELNKVYFKDSLVTVYVVNSDNKEDYLDNNATYTSIVPKAIETSLTSITFKTYIGDKVQTTYSINVEPGTLINLNNLPGYVIPNKPGYTFRGWYNLPTIMPNNSISVYGVYELNNHEVIYYVDGKEVYRDIYPYGAVISKRVNETKIGYTFSGWKYNDESFTITTMPDEDIYVYSTFNINSYTITYMIDNQEIEEYREVVNYNSKISLPIYTPNTGFIFSGWKYNGTLVSNMKMPASNIIIEGSTSIKKHDVNYYIDNKLIKTEVVEYGKPLNLVYDEKIGYTFSGWKTIDGQEVTVMGDANIKLYGSYSVNSYNLEYYINNTKVHTETYEYNQVITPYEYSLEGVTIKWLNIPDTMPANDVRIYSEKTMNLYNIEYYVDGELKYTDQCLYGSSIIYRSNEIREGHTFSGWKYNGSSVTEMKMPAENIKLYGNFTTNKYNITYYVDNKIVSSMIYSYGDIVNDYIYNPPSGYKVSSWSEDIVTMPSRNVNLYATTSLLSYNLSYFVDSELVYTEKVQYNAVITPYTYIPEIGYSISSWTGLSSDSLMPAKDLNVYAQTSKIKYLLNYYIDGMLYQSKEYYYNDEIMNLEYTAPIGKQFLGFKDVPSQMPAMNLNVYGYNSAIIYTVKYYVDENLKFTDTYTYGQSIITRGDLLLKGYAFSGWSEIPSVMPNYDVVVNGTFVANKYKVNYYCNNELIGFDEYLYNDKITIRDDLIKEGYIFSGWSSVPEYMGDSDVVVNASFSSLTCKVNYYLNDELYKVETYNYGEKITLVDSINGKAIKGWKLNDNIITELEINSLEINLYSELKNKGTITYIIVGFGSCAVGASLGILGYILVKIIKKKKTLSI